MNLESAVGSVLKRYACERGAGDEIKRAEELGVLLIPLGDARYPEKLSQISDPPELLYVWGERPEALGKFSIAVVGSRKATSYGEAAATRLSGDLARSGTVVVSGLAYGIDSTAHAAAVKNGLTVGVLGTGVDVVYPKSGKNLFDMVKKQGCLVSEFPFGMKARKWTFPMRNRIIVGLSMGVVVVEAAKKSGSLITARIALEEGREVFAVPGSIFSPASEGANHLIKQGAKCVSAFEDVLEEFGYLKTETYGTKRGDPILECLSAGPKSFEEILLETGLDTETLSSKLTVFEIDGAVSRNLAGRFILN